MTPDHSARHYGIDSDKMLDKALGLPDQLAKGWELAGPLAECMPAAKGTLVICGMGGSAIGGQLLRDLISEDSETSVHVERGYTLPAFVGKNTPVVCVSYSGNTEEVLSCFDSALERGSPLAVVTSGGMLHEKAQKAGVPFLIIPGGMPPRSALGYLFAPLLKVASCWGFCDIAEAEFRSVLRKTRKLLDTCTLEAGLPGNTPRQLAKRRYGKIPLVYSGNGLLAGAAYRWKCQFNENSKSMAFSNYFPELGHNEIMGWDSPGKILEEIFLVMLTDIDDHPQVSRRMRVTYEMLEPLAGGAIKLNSVGGPGFAGRLARLLSIVALGDLTSIYLAVESGKDPTPIDKIEEIKTLLRSEDA